MISFKDFIENREGSFQVFVENKNEATVLLETLLSFDAYTDGWGGTLSRISHTPENEYPQQEFFVFTGESDGIKRYETDGHTSRKYFDNLYMSGVYTPFMFSEVMQYYNGVCDNLDYAIECDVYDLMGV